MPKRTDLRSILIIGSGPINIGQACEFDYSGSQACRALSEAGYRVILVNSNPATIMTDPGWADATYLEPLDLDAVTQVIEIERPDALLPTLGGQTALNLAMALHQSGVLDSYEVELIGADVSAITNAEDRQVFRSLMLAHGIDTLDGVVVSDVADLIAGLAPAVVRPAFTLGGAGGGLAHTDAKLREVVAAGIAASPIGEVLVETSVEGWSEYELEVMSDTAGSCVVVCSIENIDPVGVHTGDSWTVAPQQTLSDPEYQRMRDMAFECVRAVGVATGGANVQFAYNHETGRMCIIEMNPRASRSSALASKATGYPIAKLAALVAVGLTLEELPNDITQKTTAAFEPALDYVAVKAPRFDFSKFGVDDPLLGTQMQSVGESLGLGRTFIEALIKAHEGREDDSPLPEFASAHPYFRELVRSIADTEKTLLLDGDVAFAKHVGLADARIAEVLSIDDSEVRRRRQLPERMAVDSCAAEFEASTPYFYLSFETGAANSLVADEGRGPILIVGSGPNRIGQGIEFDYSCVHAARSFRALGHEVVIVNSNPETVSTDYDTSDRLYIEPLTPERVIDVCRLERPMGVVLSLGGQTPLNLAGVLAAEGVPSLGLSVEAVALCEDRGLFGNLTDDLGIRMPAWGRAKTGDEAREIAERIGYPVMVRPDFVIGGSGMSVAYRSEDIRVDDTVLVDQFLEDAIELDVEALTDGSDVWVAGILEHVEEAGIHSGDSACVFPGPSITEDVVLGVREMAAKVAKAVKVRGPLNFQVAVAGDDLFLLEANPRASRTLPFVAKATGLPLIEWACRLMLGESLEDLDLPVDATPSRFWAKEPVFAADRFPLSTVTGPQMSSIGEVMAGGSTAVEAYRRALRAAGRSVAPGPIGPSLQSLIEEQPLRASA